MNSKKNIAIYIISIIIFFSLGFFVSKYTNNTYDRKECLKIGWDLAKKRLSETGYFSLEMDTSPVHTLSGQIINIENGKYTLATRPLSPLAEPELDERIVIINKDTAVYKIVKKDNDQYNREIKEYRKNNINYLELPDAPEGMPSRYVKKPADASDLNVKQRVVVVSKENIRNSKEIIASEITIQP